jgi:hypothetical protein
MELKVFFHAAVLEKGVEDVTDVVWQLHGLEDVVAVSAEDNGLGGQGW